MKWTHGLIHIPETKQYTVMEGTYTFDNCAKVKKFKAFELYLNNDKNHTKLADFQLQHIFSALEPH
jgi:hypothetical protein